MRWPWSKRPTALDIPPYRPIDIKPVTPKDPDIVVTQTELTETGMWRLFKRRPKEPED